MNDAQIEATKARVAPLIKRWIEPLGLKWWDIDIEYNRGAREDSDHGHASMACTVNWQYMHATIHIYPRVLDVDDEEFEMMFLHECMHIFLHETREWEVGNAIHHEEHVAQMLTKAFLWLRDSLVTGEVQE